MLTENQVVFAQTLPEKLTTHRNTKDHANMRQWPGQMVCDDQKETLASKHLIRDATYPPLQTGDCNVMHCAKQLPSSMNISL